MSFLPEFLDHLKGRLNLASLIGARVKLKRKGRYLSGLCPFHREKTPSFVVNEGEATYHCFGCGAHGDAFSFLQLSEGLSFPEAVEKLAALAGVSLPSSSSSEDRSQKTKDLYETLEAAASFFQSHLKSNQGATARQYLEKRGIRPETVEKFRLGFASDNNALKKYLLERGYKEDHLLAVGLLSQREGNSVSYDRFHHRLMFPIWDRQGRVVGFGGRLLQSGEPKYLNSPETVLFQKGELLYGHHLARLSAQKTQQLVVCEGYMDAIALHQGGIPQAVASLGTALTETQISLLWTLVPKPLLCFDGDAPGQKAAFRTLERVVPLLKSGYSLSYGFLPEGEDPDSLIRRGGVEKLKEVFESALPLEDIVWRQTAYANALNTPEGRAKFEKTLMEWVQEIKDPILRHTYRDTFKQRLFDTFRFSKKASKGKGGISLPPLKTRFEASYIQQKILFAGLLNHPQLIEDYYEAFLELELSSEYLKLLRDEMVLKISEAPALDSQELQHYLLSKGFVEIVKDILSEDIYKHATFVRPDACEESVRQGWFEVWRHVQSFKKIGEYAQNDSSSRFSPLLRAMIRREL